MPTTHYFWDEIEDNVVGEYDENNNTIANYTTEPTLYGSVLSQNRDGEVRHYQFDGQGNTTELTDANGAVTDMRRYSAFGETTESSGTTSTPFGFGGRWGYHSGASTIPRSIRRRQYDASSMRWLSFDPIIREASIRGRHPYVYGKNAPVSRLDPSGLICISQGKPDVRQCGPNGSPPLWLLKWEAWIKMDKEKNTNGFLVQRITREHFITNCCGVLLEVSTTCPTGSLRGFAASAVNEPVPLVYYEGWTMWNGNEFMDGFDEAFDSFGLDYASGTARYFRQRGELAFFPGFALPGTPNAWKIQGPEIGAGKLLVACPRDLPATFEEEFDKRVVASRGIHLSWVCCPFGGGVLSVPLPTIGACK